MPAASEPRVGRNPQGTTPVGDALAAPSDSESHADRTGDYGRLNRPVASGAWQRGADLNRPGGSGLTEVGRKAEHRDARVDEAHRAGMTGEGGPKCTSQPHE
jgi:hypothetical protein